MKANLSTTLLKSILKKSFILLQSARVKLFSAKCKQSSQHNSKRGFTLRMYLTQELESKSFVGVS